MLKRIHLRKGLTLVELAVVVLILGAIITLVALKIKIPKEDIIKLQIKKDAEILKAALETYASKYGSYPTDEEGLKALIEKPDSGNIPDDYKPFLSKKDAILDPWKNPYQLKLDSNGGYAIISLGADKREGGEGKNKDFDILKEE